MANENQYDRPYMSSHTLRENGHPISTPYRDQNASKYLTKDRRSMYETGLTGPDILLLMKNKIQGYRNADSTSIWKEKLSLTQMQGR